MAITLLGAVRKVFRGPGPTTPPVGRNPMPAPVVVDTVQAVPAPTVPTQRRARISGFGEPQNLSTQMDAERIQAALRAAERGDTWQLFTIYRDMIVGFTHLQAEWAKRKMVVCGQPHALIPKDKENKDDVIAAKVIAQMIAHCDNWMDGMSHLLDATLWPVSVAEKIYEAIPTWEKDQYDIPVRFRLKQIAPVNYTLLCFKLPYMPNGTGGVGIAPIRRGTNGYSGQDNNPALVYDVDTWEPDLRFYNTYENGYIDFTFADIYEPERERHIVHRGDLLSRAIRDNFGGPLRAILFWWLVATKDRDFFSIFMQKYGSPFILGKADAQSSDTVAMLQAAFATAVQIGGLVIDKKAEAELIQAAAHDGANAHKVFIDLCNSEVSKIVLGQTLSSTPEKTGLGSSVGNLHNEVRGDIRLYDMKKLSETLKQQLFRPYLRNNGFRGNPPDILWGGEKEGDAEMLAKSVNSFFLGGLEPDDTGIEVISQRVGYNLRRRDPATMMKQPAGQQD